MSKDQYLNSDSETVFHKNESDRLMASYGSQFSVWHSNNFRMSLSSFSMRSNLLQYSSNMRVGNNLIGLPGELGGGAELGVATQRSEFGFRLPVSFDFATTKSQKDLDLIETDKLGLYARGNIENLFSTNTDFHGLIGFSFYPSSKGDVIKTPVELINNDSTELSLLENVNIPPYAKLFLKLIGKHKVIDRLERWNKEKEGFIELCLENYDTDFKKEEEVLKKYKQGYFVTKSKRLDPSNRLLKWKLLFPEERRIPFLMTYFNIAPKPKKNNHPNGIKKIKSISYGTNAGFIPIVNELCDDNILNLFIGDGVSNLEYEK